METSKKKVAQDCTVIICVNGNNRPRWLTMSVERAINKDVRPDELIFIQDGPLGPRLKAVINEYLKDSRIKSSLLPWKKGLTKEDLFEKAINQASCHNIKFVTADTIETDMAEG